MKRVKLTDAATSGSSQNPLNSSSSGCSEAQPDYKRRKKGELQLQRPRQWSSREREGGYIWCRKERPGGHREVSRWWEAKEQENLVKTEEEKKGPNYKGSSGLKKKPKEPLQRGP